MAGNLREFDQRTREMQEVINEMPEYDDVLIAVVSEIKRRNRIVMFGRASALELLNRIVIWYDEQKTQRKHVYSDGGGHDTAYYRRRKQPKVEYFERYRNNGRKK